MHATGILLTQNSDGSKATVDLPVGRKKLSPARIKEIERMTVIAFCYVTPAGVAHWISTEKNCADAWVYVGMKNLTENPHFHVVEQTDYKKLGNMFPATICRARPPLDLLLGLSRVGVPVMSEKIAALMAGAEEFEVGKHYRSTIADMLFRRDISMYESLVHIPREKDERFTLPAWIEDVKHITGSWFGCQRVDDGVTIKMKYTKATLIEIV